MMAILLTLRLPWWPLLPSAPTACDVTNLGGCVDGAQYGFLLGIAELLWALNRTLLSLAYTLEQLRWWFSTQAFLTTYDALTRVTGPLLTPLAILAVVLALVLFLLAPLIGRIGIVNLRQLLLWLVVAPLLVAQAGPWFLSVEETRSDVAQLLAGEVSSLAAQGLFGPPQDDPEEPLPSPTPLYAPAGGTSACAAGTVTRPPRMRGSAPASALRTDDLVAAFLLANAQDIHCPAEGDPSSTLPDGFFAGTSAYVVNNGDLSQLDDAERQGALRRIQRGITRLALGLLASTLAVLDALVQLVFALSLIVVWLALPIAALLIVFAETLRPLGLIIQRAISVIVTSWVCSLLMGLLLACLTSAAASGNPTAVIAIVVGGVVFTLRLLAVALATLNESIGQVGSLVAGSLGVVATGATGGITSLAGRAIQAAISGTGKALKTVGTVATGTAAVAATAAMAYRSTASGRYAAGAALGRIRPVAQVGAVAASMGVVSEELGAGLYAGERAARSGIGAFARQLTSDTKRPLADGTTIAQRARRRSAARQLGALGQPILRQRAEDVVASLEGAQPPDKPVNEHAALIGGVQQARSAVSQRVDAGVSAHDQTPSLLNALPIPSVVGTNPKRQRQDRPRRSDVRTAMAMRLDRAGTLRFSPRQIPPPEATTKPASEVDRATLLADGYTVQTGDAPDTVTYWDAQEPNTPVTEAAATRRRRLARAGQVAPTAPQSNRAAPAARLDANLVESASRVEDGDLGRPVAQPLATAVEQTPPDLPHGATPAHASQVALQPGIPQAGTSLPMQPPTVPQVLDSPQQRRVWRRDAPTSAVTVSASVQPDAIAGAPLQHTLLPELDVPARAEPTIATRATITPTVPPARAQTPPSTTPGARVARRRRRQEEPQ